MKNTRKLAVGCVIISISFLGIALLLEWLILPEINPLRLSETAITQSLLKETPIGATHNEVKAFLQSHDWPLGRLHGWLAVMAVGMEDDQEWVSRRLGSYESLTKTTVFAEWHFDKNDRLDSIKVHKVALVP